MKRCNCGHQLCYFRVLRILVSPSPTAIWVRRDVGLEGSGSLLPDCPGLRKLAYLFAAFNLGVTGRISLDHDSFVRCVDFGCVTVWMSVAGGVIAVVAVGLFVAQT